MRFYMDSWQATHLCLKSNHYSRMSENKFISPWAYILDYLYIFNKHISFPSELKLRILLLELLCSMIVIALFSRVFKVCLVYTREAGRYVKEHTDANETSSNWQQDKDMVEACHDEFIQGDNRQEKLHSTALRKTNSNACDVDEGLMYFLSTNLNLLLSFERLSDFIFEQLSCVCYMELKSPIIS
ncbi:hypothetical protein BD560DRAFT_424640 [Blakeslea trispora]|nr:hypothetical protein BD560DRAFT_424640 [Blakeslea trispora]